MLHNLNFKYGTNSMTYEMNSRGSSLEKNNENNSNINKINIQRINPSEFEKLNSLRFSDNFSNQSTEILNSSPNINSPNSYRNYLEQKLNNGNINQENPPLNFNYSSNIDLKPKNNQNGMYVRKEYNPTLPQLRGNNGNDFNSQISPRDEFNVNYDYKTRNRINIPNSSEKLNNQNNLQLPNNNLKIINQNNLVINGNRGINQNLNDQPFNNQLQDNFQNENNENVKEDQLTSDLIKDKDIELKENVLNNNKENPSELNFQNLQSNDSNNLNNNEKNNLNNPNNINNLETGNNNNINNPNMNLQQFNPQKDFGNQNLNGNNTDNNYIISPRNYDNYSNNQIRIPDSNQLPNNNYNNLYPLNDVQKNNINNPLINNIERNRNSYNPFLYENRAYMNNNGLNNELNRNNPYLMYGENGPIGMDRIDRNNNNYFLPNNMKYNNGISGGYSNQKLTFGNQGNQIDNNPNNLYNNFQNQNQTNHPDLSNQNYPNNQLNQYYPNNQLNNQNYPNNQLNNQNFPNKQLNNQNYPNKQLNQNYRNNQLNQNYPNNQYNKGNYPNNQFNNQNFQEKHNDNSPNSQLTNYSNNNLSDNPNYLNNELNSNNNYPINKTNDNQNSPNNPLKSINNNNKDSDNQLDIKNNKDLNPNNLIVENNDKKENKTEPKDKIDSEYLFNKYNKNPSSNDDENEIINEALNKDKENIDNNNPDDILSTVELIKQEDLNNISPNEQINILLTNNKQLYNALKKLQKKYNNLKEEYDKLLRIQDKGQGNNQYKEFLKKENDDYKRQIKNYEKILIPLVDYVNDINHSLGKKELDIPDLKKIAKKLNKNKSPEEEDNEPLDKYTNFINKCGKIALNKIEADQNKDKIKEKLFPQPRKIIKFGNNLDNNDTTSRNNSEIDSLRNKNEKEKINDLNKKNYIKEEDDDDDNDDIYNYHNIEPNKYNDNFNKKKIKGFNIYNNKFRNPKSNFKNDSKPKNKTVELNDNNNENEKNKDLKKKKKKKDFYYWKKNHFVRGKSGRIITDSDEEIQAEKRKRRKFLLGDDKNYAYDYYGNRDWECVACDQGIFISSKGFSPLMCSPNKDLYLQNNIQNNQE